MLKNGRKIPAGCRYAGKLPVCSLWVTSGFGLKRLMTLINLNFLNWENVQQIAQSRFYSLRDAGGALNLGMV